MFDKERMAVEEKIQSYCSRLRIPEHVDFNWARIPFSGEWGISTSFFQLAAIEARAGKVNNVPQRAQEHAEAVKEYLGIPDGFARVEAVKGYLNLYFITEEYAHRVVVTVLKEGDDFGRGEPKGELVMVEFSQPNTHKALHVGHLRNMVLGDSLANILEFAGYEVVRANYIGDVGLDVIKWLWNYQKYHLGEEPGQDKTRWMGDIYSEATQRLEEEPTLENEMREVFARWDQREPEIVALWEKTRQWSLDGFDQIYTLMGIRFDRLYYESQVEQPGKAMVTDLIDRGIAVDERPDGPVIVRIDDLLGQKKEKFRVAVVLRSDGTALYSTMDIALAKKKFSDYNLDRSIYVVDVRQSLHFEQVFKILEIAGFEHAKKCVHLPYEIVNLPGNVTMKSREGTVVLLEDLIRETTQRALDVVQEKNPLLAMDEQREVSEAVAIGAIKYPMLARDNTKIATFDWDSALDFNGHAAPYIQYAHVRANSILRKVGARQGKSNIISHKLTSSEIELVDKVSRFPEEVQRAASDFKTLRITNLAFELARAFNDFYKQCPVLKAEPNVREARLLFVDAARQTIKNSLRLLGITSPLIM
jgi:arginyl-tRNA synthetase